MKTGLYIIILLNTCLLVCGCPDRRTKAQQMLATQITSRQAAKETSIELYRKGMAAYEAGDFIEAHKCLAKSVSQDDRNVRAWMALGVVEFERDSFFEAAHAFHRVARLAPTRYEPHFNLGIILESVGRHTQAIEAYEKALKLAPHQTEVMENMARCYIRTDQDLDKARGLIDQALLDEHRPRWQQWLERQSLRLSLVKESRKGN